MDAMLLCPRCQRLLLDTARQQVSGVCLSCGWRDLPRHASLLPAPPCAPQKRLLAATLGSLWLAGGGALLAFSPSEKRWQMLPLPQPWALNGLAFATGIVLVAPGEEHPFGDPKPLLGLDARTGQVVWQVEGQGFQWTAPVANETMACAVDSRGQAAVIHPRNGQPCWERNLSLGNFPHRGLAPALSPSFLLLVMPQGELHWFSRANGRRWGTFLPLSGNLDCSPVCHEEMAFFYAGPVLYRLDLLRGQGQELFRAARQSSQGWFFAAPQWTPAGLLILHADWDEAHRPAYALSLLDAESGVTRWKFPLSRHPYFAPAVKGQILALPDRAGHLLLLDLESGQEKACLPLKESPAAAPVFLEDEIFLLTEGGGLLRFSPHLRLENLPDSPAEYLQRGNWQAAALKQALQGRLNQAAELYKTYQCLPEARTLYDLAGNTAASALLTRQGADFRLRLRTDSPVREGAYSLLEVQVENLGAETIYDARLTCSSSQVEITRRSYRFGALLPGEAKTWNTLQVSPKTGQRGELLLKMVFSYRAADDRRHRLVFEQGLTVLQGEQAVAREIHIHIGGNVTNSVIIAGEQNTVTKL